MIFGPVERMIGWRYLRARREEGFISVIAWFSLVGIALGVGTLIVVMSVMNGFRADMLEKIMSVSGHVVVGWNRGSERPQPLIDRLRAVQGVLVVAPVVDGQVMAIGGDALRGVLLRGVEGEQLAKRPGLTAAMQGTLSGFDSDRNAAIGARLAELLGLKLGDDLTLVSPQSVDTPLGRVPRTGRFRVTAIFDTGMFDFDANFAFVPLADAQSFLGMGGKIGQLEIFGEDPSRFLELRDRVTKVVGSDAYVYDWLQANAPFFAMVETQTRVVFLVLALIVLVAAFNIVSSLTMLVRTKGQDIAILRTMGASRGAVLRVFLLAGMTLGGVGTLVGAVLGLAFARNIDAIRRWIEAITGQTLFPAELYQLVKLPGRIEAVDVAAIVAMALAFALVASLWPAWRAARLEPVEGLRRE